MSFHDFIQSLADSLADLSGMQCFAMLLLFCIVCILLSISNGISDVVIEFIRKKKGD